MNALVLYDSQHGIASFLKRIPSEGLKGIRVGAFDTRLAEGDIELAALRFIK